MSSTHKGTHAVAWDTAVPMISGGDIIKMNRAYDAWAKRRGLYTEAPQSRAALAARNKKLALTKPAPKKRKR